MPTPSQAPAFVIGVTGHMDIPAADIPEVESRFRQLFRWLREASDAGNEVDRSRPDWWPQIPLPQGKAGQSAESVPIPGLGLGKQHIVLLTSLAPGADTIAARIALEEGIAVRAPIPFPAELYPQSTTFTGAENPEEAISEFRGLISEPEFAIDDFPVLLASDLDLSAEDRGKTFADDLHSDERLNLRYRAAGEYVGTYCHLLFALIQPDAAGTESSAGSQTIVDIARTGPTAGILPAANSFPWNDAVPVIHVPCRSLKRMPEGGTLEEDAWQKAPATFLPPFWLSASDDGEETAAGAECIRDGYETLRGSAELLSEYSNAAEAKRGKQGPAEDCFSSGGSSAFASLVDTLSLAENGLSAEGREFVRELTPIAQERSIVSSLAREADRSRSRMMTLMAVCAFLAAVFFHCFSHWHFENKSSNATLRKDLIYANQTKEHAHQEEPGKKGTKTLHFWKPLKWTTLKYRESVFALAFLVMALLFIAMAAIAFFGYNRSRKEWLRFDARALSEGLRVQFYWSLVGTRYSVAGRYMNRQKGELDWIRNAISSLSFPYSRWREKFLRLDESDQRNIISAVMQKWIIGQRDFFGKKVVEREHELHRFHGVGWGMTWAGISQIVLFFLWKLIDPSFHERYYLISGLALLVAAISVIVRANIVQARLSSVGGSHGVHDLLDRILARGFPGFALLVSALLMLAVWWIPGAAWWTPKDKDLWIILTGSSLVAGAIAIAWSEKKLLSEQVRQYGAMHSLFQNAAEHLDALLGQWEGNDSLEDELSQIDPLSEIQETMFGLGKEALDENAEWLVLHRSRPFEPFLAG